MAPYLLSFSLQSLSVVSLPSFSLSFSCLSLKSLTKGCYKKNVMYTVHPTELAQLYSVHYVFFCNILYLRLETPFTWLQLGELNSTKILNYFIPPSVPISVSTSASISPISVPITISTSGSVTTSGTLLSLDPFLSHYVFNSILFDCISEKYDS